MNRSVQEFVGVAVGVRSSQLVVVSTRSRKQQRPLHLGFAWTRVLCKAKSQEWS